LTQIILARHGQTAWNKGEVFRGHTDIDLDETGEWQAERLANYLADNKIEAVYSSPRIRALKTARAIASRQKIEAQAATEIDDISFGRWEGKSIDQVKVEDKVLFTQWVVAPQLVKLPGGESLDEVTRRAMTLVEAIVQKHQGTVVLVSHQVVHKALILAMLGLDNSHFWNVVMDTAAITTFSWQQNMFVLREHNNACYVKNVERPRSSSKDVSE
jgi:phosphoserine phosphatase